MWKFAGIKIVWVNERGTQKIAENGVFRVSQKPFFSLSLALLTTYAIRLDEATKKFSNAGGSLL